MKASKRRLWLIPTIVSGVSLVGVIGWWHLWMARPMGSGPAGPFVDPTAFTHAWSERPVLLMGLGDSVTAGFGVARGRSYFERLIKNPPDEFADMRGLSLAKIFPMLSVTNLSISGSTSVQHLRSELPRLPRQSSNTLGLVVITTGGNDLIHNYGRTPPSAGAMYGATFEEAKQWIDDFASRLETILTGIRNAFPGGCHIFLANIYDPTDSVGDIERAGLPAWSDGLRIHAEYNGIIAATAERQSDVHLVDIHSAFLGHGIHCTQFWRGNYDSRDPHYWYHSNLEDPNDRGYDALRRLFLNAIAGVFSEKRK